MSKTNNWIHPYILLLRMENFQSRFWCFWSNTNPTSISQILKRRVHCTFIVRMWNLPHLLLFWRVLLMRNLTWTWKTVKMYAFHINLPIFFIDICIFRNCLSNIWNQTWNKSSKRNTSLIRTRTRNEFDRVF